jgi:hypothetical protein
MHVYNNYSYIPFKNWMQLFKTKITARRQIKIFLLFVETPRKFITAKLSIRKPGSSSVLINMWLVQFTRPFIYKSVVICWLPQTKVLYVLWPCKPTKNLKYFYFNSISAYLFNIEYMQKGFFTFTVYKQNKWAY